MASNPRISAPDVFYHITARGIPERNIFPTPALKRYFLIQLAITLKQYSFTCIGWSLQKDHYHLIVKSDSHCISSMMQRLNSVYARKFNSENDRKGVVFYRRFASIIVQDTSLRELIRYVHLNPVRCGNCKMEELDHYEWSGHSAVQGNCQSEFLDKEELLKLFGPEEALTNYSSFLKETAPDCSQDEIVAHVRIANQSCQNCECQENWVYGDNEFVRKVLLKSQILRTALARHQSLNISREKLHKLVEKVTKVPADAILHHSRANIKSTARALFAFAGVYLLDYSAKILAKYLGVSCSAVSKMIARFRNDPQGLKLVEQIRVELM